jgi:hypothetical protein
MILSIVCFIALVLLVWFRTDGYLEYCRLLRLDALSFYKDYEDKKYNDATLTYLNYLRRDHNCFFVRLITCPICFTVWLAIIPTVLTSIVLFPVFVMGALLLFTAIDRLLG